MNKESYLEVKKHLHELSSNKGPLLKRESDKCTTLTMHSHTDHSSLIIQVFVKHKTAVVPHPTYSHDLVPAGFNFQN